MNRGIFLLFLIGLAAIFAVFHYYGTPALKEYQHNMDVQAYQRENLLP